MSENDVILHWYDFLCPFCYVGQSRSAILIRHGLNVSEIPFQAHPEIPATGVAAGPRIGPMYRNLEREAEEAGLILNWPARFPDTRRALAAAEWVWRNQPHNFEPFQRDLFAAHFVLGEDLGNTAVIDQAREQSGCQCGRFTPLSPMGRPCWPWKNPRRWAADTVSAARQLGLLRIDSFQDYYRQKTLNSSPRWRRNRPNHTPEIYGTNKPYRSRSGANSGENNRSGSDESTSRKVWSSGTCFRWQMPCMRTCLQSAAMKAIDGNGKSDKRKLFRQRQTSWKLAGRNTKDPQQRDWR